MGPAAGLELCQQVADMALDRLLGEEEPDADLAVTAVLSGRADLVGAPVAILHTGPMPA